MKENLQSKPERSSWELHPVEAKGLQVEGFLQAQWVAQVDQLLQHQAQSMVDLVVKILPSLATTTLTSLEVVDHTIHTPRHRALPPVPLQMRQKKRKRKTRHSKRLLTLTLTRNLTVINHPLIVTTQKLKEKRRRETRRKQRGLLLPRLLLNQQKQKRPRKRQQNQHLLVAWDRPQRLEGRSRAHNSLQ